MKKIYQRPAITEIEVELTQIVCLSKVGDTNASSGNLSRRSDNDLWEDDIDE